MSDQVDRFSFGGHDLTDMLFVNPTRSFAPPIENVTVKVPGRPGEIHVRAELQPLEIPLHVRLKMDPADAEAVAAQRRKITAILVTDEPQPLVLPDEPTRFYMAILSDPGELDTLWYAGGADIVFTAYDPIAHGKTRDAELPGGETRVFVEGSWETRPTIRLEADGQPLRVSMKDGPYIALVTNPDAGASVVIDMADERCTVDGEAVAIELGSDYFALQPDNNFLTITGGSGSIEWEERWK